MSLSEHDLVRNVQPPVGSNGKSYAPFDLAQTTSGIGMIIVDGVRHSKSLAGLAGQLEIFLDDIEILMSADGVETLRYDHKLRPSKQRVKIEMPPHDTCDVTPHCHVTHNNKDACYDLEDFNWIGGATVAPRTAEMVRRFFVYYGGGKRMALITKPDLGKRPLLVEHVVNFAFDCQSRPSD